MEAEIYCNFQGPEKEKVIEDQGIHRSESNTTELLILASAKATSINDVRTTLDNAPKLAFTRVLLQ